MSSLDDLIRLAAFANGGTVADTAPRPLPPPAAGSLAPSGPVVDPSPPRPIYQDASGMPAPDFFERAATAGDANPLVRPLSTVLDLIGTIARGGHSGYSDAARREHAQQLAESLYRDRAKQQAEQEFANPRTPPVDPRIAAVEKRMGQMQEKLDASRARRAALADAARQPGLDANALASIKAEHEQHVQYETGLTGDMAKLAAQSGLDSAPSPIAEPPAETLPGAPIPPKPVAGMLGADGTLTEDGLNYAADYLNQTGTMLPMGMGNAAMRAKVFNRAAERLKASGGNLGENKAGQAADTKSLQGLQPLYDNATAFENTALRNAKVLKDAMARIRNTRSPILNSPLRSIDKKLLGSDEMAAYRAALGTVQTEFSRLLGSPGASGVLSDASRKEGAGLLDGSYSLRQMLAAIESLRKDAENKRASYQQQINEVKGRIRDRGAPRPNPSGQFGAPATSDLPPGAVRVR